MLDMGRVYHLISLIFAIEYTVVPLPENTVSTTSPLEFRWYVFDPKHHSTADFLAMKNEGWRRARQPEVTRMNPDGTKAVLYKRTLKPK